MGWTHACPTVNPHVVATQHRDDGKWTAVPDVYEGAEGRSGPVLLTIEVEGELFAVRRSGGGGTHYDWLTGRHEGYGFGLSASPESPQEEHREHIRTFLEMIDPDTGYIAEE